MLQESTKFYKLNIKNICSIYIKRWLILTCLIRALSPAKVTRDKEPSRTCAINDAKFTELQMADKHEKRHWTSLVIRKMKIKTIRHFSITGLAKIVENVNIQCWQGVTMFPVIIKNVKIKGPSCSLVLILNLSLIHYVTLNKSLPLSGS